MITNSDLTLYNKYTLSGAEKYQRTQIQDVAWENRKAANVIRSGMLAANQASIYIPYARGANHLDPKAWLALVTKTGKWTLSVGDVLVQGLVTDEIAGAFTISSLIAKYDNVLKITSVDFRNLGSQSLWHWEVGAA